MGDPWHLAQQAQLILAGGLTLALVLGAVATAARSSYLRDLSRRDLLLLAGCLLLALAMRLYARTFLASTSMESAQVVGPGSAHRWAAGMSAILQFLSLFAQVNVASIAKLNVVVSLVTIVALFFLVDAYFQDRLAAFSAVAVLALQPISARYANSDSTAILQTLCLVAGAAFLARWNRAPRRALLLQGVGWLALAANIRYECVLYFVAGAFIVIGGGGWPQRGRTRELVTAGLFGVLFLLYPVGRAMYDMSGGTFEGSPLGYLSLFLHSPYSSAAIVVVAFGGLVVATLERFRAAVALLLALVAVSVPGNYIPLECGEFSHRFGPPRLAFWAVFAGYGCSVGRRLVVRAVRRLRGGAGGPAAETPHGIPVLAAGVVLLLAAAAAIPPRAFLTRMWTYALEYDFIVAHLRELPDECLIVGPDPFVQDARGLRPTWHLSAEVGRHHRWMKLDDPGLLAGTIEPCTIYYRATACYAYESAMAPQNPTWTGAERPVCRRIGELFDLDPIATTMIPSRSYVCEAHTMNPVPAGFYRLRPKGAGTRAGNE